MTSQSGFSALSLASASGLLITTSVSPAATRSPSSTRKRSIRPGNLPEIRISVASICPCNTTGLRSSRIIPITETIVTATSTMTNEKAKYFFVLSIIARFV